MIDYKKTLTRQQIIAIHNTLVLGMKVDPCLVGIEGFVELKPSQLMVDFFSSLMQDGLRIDEIYGDIVTDAEYSRRSTEWYMQAIKK